MNYRRDRITASNSEAFLSRLREKVYIRAKGIDHSMQKGNESGFSKPSSIIGRPSRTIRVRSFILFSVCTFFAAIIIGRLFYLQIIKHKDYRRLVLEQMVYETTVTAKRGQITDRNGVVLATNYTTERIFIDPHVMEDDAERALVAKGLSEILDVDYDFVYGEAQKTQYRDRTIKKMLKKKPRIKSVNSSLTMTFLPFISWKQPAAYIRSARSPLT